MWNPGQIIQPGEKPEKTQRKSLREKDRLSAIMKFIWRVLTSGPPLFYLLAYLFLIILFAFVFWCIREDFYHSTVKYEPFIQTETEEILEGLKTAFVEEAKKKHPNGIVANTEGVFRTSMLRTRTWNVEGGRASFELCAYLPPKPSEVNARWRKSLREKPSFHDFPRYWGVRVSFNIRPSQFTHKPTLPGEELIWMPNMLITLDQLVSLASKDHGPLARASDIFNTFKGLDGKERMYLPISRELSDRILAFADGMRGRPTHLPGNFVRMLYLSAVTITTLGYGDIVPLTTLGRLCITAEAILGMVLIGLFLNSLRGKLKQET